MEKLVERKNEEILEMKNSHNEQVTEFQNTNRELVHDRDTFQKQSKIYQKELEFIKSQLEETKMREAEIANSLSNEQIKVTTLESNLNNAVIEHRSEMEKIVEETSVKLSNLEKSSLEE